MHQIVNKVGICDGNLNLLPSLFCPIEISWEYEPPLHGYHTFPSHELWIQYTFWGNYIEEVEKERAKGRSECLNKIFKKLRKCNLTLEWSLDDWFRYPEKVAQDEHKHNVLYDFYMNWNWYVIKR